MIGTASMLYPSMLGLTDAWVLAGAAGTSWLIIILTLCLALYRWLQHQWHHHAFFEKMGVPFVPPHLIYGSNHTLMAGLPTEVMGSWIKKYGKLFGYFIGWRPTLMVSDLDLIKQIMVKDSHIWINRPKLAIKAVPVTDCLVCLRGQRWKDVRSLLAPTFSAKKMKIVAGLMNEKIDELIQIISETSSMGLPVEMWKTYQAMTLDTITHTALAMKTNCQRGQEKDEFFMSVKSFLKTAVNPAVRVSLYFPMVASIMCFISDKLAYSGRMTQIIMNNLREVMALRRKDLTVKNIDLLQTMLEVSEVAPTELKDASGYRVVEGRSMKLLTDMEIIANAWVFLLGGFETTANSITYTSYLLAMHQDVQEKLYQEVTSVIQDHSSHISYDEIAKMSYLDQVFSESLRVITPVVLFISREAGEDTKLGDIFIPKDMKVFIPLWELHHDPEQWPNPDVFDPERFSASAKATDTRHPMSYLPFGTGPRQCPGIRFGMQEAKMAIARIVANFRLEPCEQTPTKIPFEIPTMTLNPKNGIYVRYVPRH